MWQPKQMDGFELTLGLGTPVWFDCVTSDFDAVCLSTETSWGGRSAGARLLAVAAIDDSAA